MTYGARFGFRFAMILLAITAMLTAFSGCGKDKDKPQVVTREGRVASINAQSGQVEMWLWSSKHKKEIKIPGKLDPNIEIFINGAAANIGDVEVDDKITVTGKVVRVGEEKEFIALKVEVTRPVRTSTTTPAASAPAP